MARTKSKVSPFWKPETPGEKIEGIYIGQQTTQSPDGKPGMAFNLLLKNGTKLVPITYQLRNMFSGVVGKLRSGKSKLRFIYVERIKLKKGRSMRKFEAYLDGKQLEDVTAFSNVPDASQLSAFWGKAGKPAK